MSEEARIVVGQAFASIGAGEAIGKVVEAHLKGKAANQARQFSEIGLPKAIRVTRNGEKRYISTLNATVEELNQSIEVRKKNIQDAQKKLREMQATVDALRPLMEEQPTRTVIDALTILVKARLQD